MEQVSKFTPQARKQIRWYDKANATCDDDGGLATPGARASAPMILTKYRQLLHRKG